MGNGRYECWQNSHLKKQHTLIINNNGVPFDVCIHIYSVNHELVADLTRTHYAVYREMRVLFMKGRMLKLSPLYKARHSKRSWRGGHSQAQPLHHALPRLRRGGAGIGSCFNLTGEGIAGKDGRSEVSVSAQN